MDDFESEWDFSKPFDFIHASTLAGSVKDFPVLFKRTIDNLKPGGWVELVDAPFGFFSDDGTLEKAPNLKELARLHEEASQKFGKEMNSVYSHKQRLIDVGFKNVKEEIYKVCFNTTWIRRYD